MIDFQTLLSTLVRHNVKFILIGGAAAVAHGAARLTEDLDILYERSHANLEQLIAALAAYKPYLRGVPEGLPFQWHADTLARGLNFTLTTNFGDVDLFGDIPGGGTYHDLAAGAIEIDLFENRCLCLSVDQLIAAKRATGRPKDLEAIAELEAIRDEAGS